MGNELSNQTQQFGGDLVEQLQTPEQWCKELGIEILDADGWRAPDAKDWTDPINRAEFDERAATCTQRSVTMVEQERAAQRTAHDGAFVKELSAQADAFFGFDKIRTALTELEYLHIRTSITGRPIRDWRQAAAIATTLAQCGMTAEDIADLGIEATLKIESVHGRGGKPEVVAELVALLANVYQIKGELIMTIPGTIDRVLETLR